ncbi:helix-turn-helix transcriptional regulator [Gryllotalpicola reticulitermitis]|uniref:Helix-turn-helix transcriptional regulator n=1 Tax=Gryllotalpicola reticulitermitis TaxID=1184153 RepID=A0ABV8QEB3_9MICO
MRVSFAGPDPWIGSTLSQRLASVDKCEYLGQAPLDSELHAEAELVVLDGAAGGSASHRAVELAHTGRRVLIVIEEIGRPHILAAREATGVRVFRRSEGPEQLVELILQILHCEETDAEDEGPLPNDTVRLSAQERRVLILTARSASAREIGHELGVTSGTVAAYLRRIRAKYAIAGRPARTKLDLYRRAVEDELITE